MKIKTSSSMKKRFKVTGSGKIKSAKAAHNHRLMQKSKRQKNKSRNGLNTSPADIKLVKRGVPGFVKRRKPLVKKVES